MITKWMSVSMVNPFEAHPCKSRLCRKSCVWPHASFKDLVCISSTAGMIDVKSTRR